MLPLLGLHKEAPSTSSCPWTDMTNISAVNECPLEKWIHIGCKVDMVTMLEKAINYVKFLQLQVKVESGSGLGGPLKSLIRWTWTWRCWFFSGLLPWPSLARRRGDVAGAADEKAGGAEPALSSDVAGKKAALPARRLLAGDRHAAAPAWGRRPASGRCSCCLGQNRFKAGRIDSRLGELGELDQRAAAGRIDSRQLPASRPASASGKLTNVLY